MLAEFWGEAVSTAVFLLNRAPTKSLAGMTPYEAWHGRKPAVHYLRTFGCLAYVKEQGNLRKLDEHSSPAVFIGYEEGVKAYRLLDPVTRRIRIARHLQRRTWLGLGSRRRCTLGQRLPCPVHQSSWSEGTQLCVQRRGS
jgi:hypothetical protein